MPNYVVVHEDGTATVHRNAIPKSQLRRKPRLGNPLDTVVTTIGRLPPPLPKALDRSYMTRKRAVTPEFVDTLQDIWRHQNDNITLRVGYRGYPDPDVLWLRNGEPIVPDSDDASSRVQVATGEGNAELTIFDARRADSGFYTCRIENERAVRETRCVVRVTDAPGRLEPDSAAHRRMAPSVNFREYRSILYTPAQRYYGSPSI